MVNPENSPKVACFSPASKQVRRCLFLWILAFCVSSASAQEPIRHPSPALSLYDHQDQPVNLTDYRGQVVMVSFWATWCPPCIEEFPSQQKLKEAYKNRNFEVLAVNMGQGKTDIEGFLFSLDMPVNFPVLLDPDSHAARDWQVSALPTTILVDKQGKQVISVTGPRDWDSEKNRDIVAALLNEAMTE